MSYGNHIARSPLLLVLALVCATGSSAAQCCRPTLGVDEVVAGAGGNAVLRGPWVTAGWRKPLPRLALFTLGSFTYERFVDHSGWSASDFNQRLASYLVTEALVSGVHWLQARVARRRATTRALALRRGAGVGGALCTAPPLAGESSEPCLEQRRW
jgi:hypothetical protein